MTAYLYNAPNGVPGDITRSDESNVEPAMMVTPFPTVFGVGVIYGTGGVKLPSGDAATAFAGVLVREVPGIANSSASDVIADAAPYQKQVQGLMVRGYVAVSCAAGTPVRGGVVYWQVTDHSGVLAGSFRADGTDSGNAVALTAAQAEWATDGVDADLNAELRVAR